MLRANCERFDIGRDADGELRSVPTLSADAVRAILNGVTEAPEETTVRVAGRFQHDVGGGYGTRRPAAYALGVRPTGQATPVPPSPQYPLGFVTAN